MVETPEPPPEAALIARVRKAAGMTIEQAAAAARERTPGLRLSAEWFRAIELGYERKSGSKTVIGSAMQIAHMARAVGLSPERVETEGRRPDAADVLREMLQSSPAIVLDAVRARWGSVEAAPRDVQVVVRTPRLPDWAKLEFIEGYVPGSEAGDGAAPDARRRA
jgi:hypothetical protein